MFRNLRAERPVDDAEPPQEHHRTAGVAGVHHAVVLGHVVRQRGKGLAGQFPHGLTV